MISSAALDTNILIYAHIEDYKEHAVVGRWLTHFMAECEVFYLTWQIFYEYIRIVTHPRVHRHPLTVAEALADMDPYLTHARCRILSETENHYATLREISVGLPSARGNFTFDCYIATILKEHAISTIVTADTDFLKFRFLKIVNPLENAT